MRKRPKKAPLPPVSLGGITREIFLPFPVVYYPGIYGAFLGFAQSEGSPIYFCECVRSSIENSLRLRELPPIYRNSNPLREAPFDSMYFPKVIAEMSCHSSAPPLSLLHFAEGLCHRCTLTTPSWRYCHEMYGGNFMQHYGWYVAQAYFRLGIYPEAPYKYLPDVCPPDFQIAIKIAEDIRNQAQLETDSMMALVHGPKRDDIPPDQPTYWQNVTIEDAIPMQNLQREATHVERAFTKMVEDIARQEFGFKKVGEGWVSETLLFQLISRILHGHEIYRHHRPSWLNGLELDIFVPDFKLALEYQGQQHFHPIKAWGGERGFHGVQLRDAKKARLCQAKGVKLITVDYTEPLTEEYIRGIVTKHLPQL